MIKSNINKISKKKSMKILNLLLSFGQKHSSVIWYEITANEYIDVMTIKKSYIKKVVVSGFIKKLSGSPSSSDSLSLNESSICPLFL